jgi:hypothetical protein
VVPFDWIEAHAWMQWDAPRNYIAGEVSYAKALMQITGPPCANGYCWPVVVRLLREPGNPHDANAIRAEVSGARLGYLRRHLAAQVTPALDGAGLREFWVPGLLRGGSTSATHVGCHVWLDRSINDDGVEIKLPEHDEWIVPWPINAWERP